MKPRTCAYCGANLKGVGGFMLSRDVLVVLKGGPALPRREFGNVCMVNIHPDIIALNRLKQA